jgi:protein TonB
MRYGPESWPKTDRAGAVTLSLHVTPEGRAERCTVARPSPWPEIDARFCAFALRRFRFEPALDSAGRPVADIVDFRFDFKPPS